MGAFHSAALDDDGRAFAALRAQHHDEADRRVALFDDAFGGALREDRCAYLRLLRGDLPPGTTERAFVFALWDSMDAHRTALEAAAPALRRCDAPGDRDCFAYWSLRRMLRALGPAVLRHCRAASGWAADPAADDLWERYAAALAAGAAARRAAGAVRAAAARALRAHLRALAAAAAADAAAVAARGGAAVRARYTATLATLTDLLAADAALLSGA